MLCQHIQHRQSFIQHVRVVTFAVFRPLFQGPASVWALGMAGQDPQVPAAGGLLELQEMPQQLRHGHRIACRQVRRRLLVDDAHQLGLRHAKDLAGPCNQCFAIGGVDGQMVSGPVVRVPCQGEGDFPD